MNSLKDINKDLDDITDKVEKVYNKFTPYKKKTESIVPQKRSDSRNYHPPLT
jgi:peptidoglycan hydrolase CwlO-like protein